MTIFKPIYPPLHTFNVALFPELNDRKAALVPVYVNPAQVVSIDVRGVPTLHLADGRYIETQFPTTEHLEYYMASNGSSVYRSGDDVRRLFFRQVTEIGSSEDSDVQVDKYSENSGDCQSEGSEGIDAGYTPDGPVYTGVLPELEVEEKTWGGVLDVSSCWMRHNHD